MTILERIKSKGYWRIIIRPARFNKDKVKKLVDLFPLVKKASVSFRRWDFPHIDMKKNPHIESDWVGQESEFGGLLELWRIYKSGQFIIMRGLWSDWLRQEMFPQISLQNELAKYSYLGIHDAVFTLTEIYEFATRLSLTEVGDNQVNISVQLCKIKDRYLISGHPLHFPHISPKFIAKKSECEDWTFDRNYNREKLISGPRDLACDAVIELFQMFNWDIDRSLVFSLQNDLEKEP